MHDLEVGVELRAVLADQSAQVLEKAVAHLANAQLAIDHNREWESGPEHVHVHASNSMCASVRVFSIS